VLLLEAGGEDTSPAIHDPARLAELWHSPNDWDYFTTPQAGANDRRLHLPRGKVLGGSHALNAMIWVRGTPWDYDGWAELGAEGWGWDTVLPVLKQIEQWHGRPDASRGTDGMLHVQPNEPLHPIQQAILDSAVAAGVPLNPDYNAGEQDGISVQQVTIREQRRVSTWMAYAQPIMGNERFAVRTGTWVHRILLTDGRATGVEVEVDGRIQQIHADAVVLCAGALDSPRILLGSGIGPADDLAALGIEVQVDLPGVGGNLHDHLLSPVIFATDRREVEAPAVGRSVTQTHLFWRSRPGLPVPDTQPINFSVPMYEPWMTGPASGFSLMAGMITPKSRGRLTLSDADPHAPIRIDLQALAEREDVESLMASVRQCQQIGAVGPLADEWGAREIYPGPDVQDDAALEAYVRNTAITYHHQVGTCRMGIDADSVVDPTLSVHGVEGVWIADASVMPRVPTGNTNAPSAVIGERAAAFVLERARLSLR
jgi:choline dehydrogenase-like flavoprotein